MENLFKSACAPKLNQFCSKPHCANAELLLRCTPLCSAAVLDQDKDGFLSADDLSAALRECDISVRPEVIRRLIATQAPSRGSSESGLGLISAASFQVWLELDYC